MIAQHKPNCYKPANLPAEAAHLGKAHSRICRTSTASPAEPGVILRTRVEPRPWPAVFRILRVVLISAYSPTELSSRILFDKQKRKGILCELFRVAAH